jgi:hypothetical protein
VGAREVEVAIAVHITHCQRLHDDVEWHEREAGGELRFRRRCFRCSEKHESEESSCKLKSAAKHDLPF